MGLSGRNSLPETPELACGGVDPTPTPPETFKVLPCGMVMLDVLGVQDMIRVRGGLKMVLDKGISS